MHQYKKSQDLEVFEMDYTNNAHLQEVCDIRQPIIFDIRPVSNVIWQELSPQQLARYAGQTVELKNTQDYILQSSPNSNIDSVSVSLSTAKTLCDTDDQSRYFSENNYEFLESTGIAKRLHSIDSILKPTFVIHTANDLLFGSSGTHTPLQYHTYYRRFLLVALGRIRVKMIPWKHTGSLNTLYDYEHYEFRSSVDPRSFTTDILEFDVLQGSVLFIPPYWWYSIQYISSVDSPETLVYSVSYTTIMNLMSNLPNLGLYWLQQQNIVSKVSKVSTFDSHLDHSTHSVENSVLLTQSVVENTNTCVDNVDLVKQNEEPISEENIVQGETISTNESPDLPIKNEQIIKLEEKVFLQKIAEPVISVSNI